MAEMTIRRFGVLSVAKIYGLLMFIFGMIIGVIYGLILIVFGAAMSAMGPGRECSGGWRQHRGDGSCDDDRRAVVLRRPGIHHGAIGAMIYNAVAGIIGGVKFELEGVQEEYAPPPPPHQWAPNQYPAQ